MKSRRHTVTSSNSPLTIPLDNRGGPISIGATPTAATYTVEYTVNPLQEGLTNGTFPISVMTGVTSAQSAQFNAITAFVVTLDAGTSVDIDVAQSDV